MSDLQNENPRPTSEEFYAAFGVGDRDDDLNAIDVAGVAFASLQALRDLCIQQESQIERLEADVESLKARLLSRHSKA